MRPWQYWGILLFIFFLQQLVCVGMATGILLTWFNFIKSRHCLYCYQKLTCLRLFVEHNSYIFVLLQWFICICRLIDCFRVDSAITSVTMSPTSDFLVTAHLDDVGVYLWANKTLFTHVPLTALPANFEPQLIDLPSTGKPNSGKGSHKTMLFKCLNDNDTSKLLL